MCGRVGVCACVQDLFGFQGGGGGAMDLCFFPLSVESRTPTESHCVKKEVQHVCHSPGVK